MSFEGTSNAHWRGRAIAVAGIAAAATIAGFALATSASAATPPSLSWDAPTQVVNDGNASAAGTLTINNSGAGHADLGAHVVRRLTIVGPASLNCANIELNGDLSWTTLTGAGGTCTEDVSFTQGLTNVDYTEDLSVNQAGLTGTLTSTIALIQRNGTDTADLATLATGTDTTALVNGHAAAFTGAAVPPGFIYHNYSFQFGTDAGFPKAGLENGYVYAFGTHLHSNGTYTCNYNNQYGTTIGGTTHQVIDLSDNVYYDITLGQIHSWSNPTETNSVRYWTWTLIANNGEGGAAAPTVGVACGGTSVPTPSLSTHDVTSHPFSTPVLFTDVPLSSPFATEIYDLSDNNDISGFADGTFRPTANISRQAFVTILAGYRGTCSIFHPSPFSDVPNSNPFCEPIRDLYEDGIVGGFANHTFHPGADVTRQAMSAFFYRANAVWNLSLSNPGDALCTTPVPFNDVSTSNPFCGDIEWMSDNGIANGFGDGGFHPTANSSRQATAAFIDRFNNL